jgi:hypothetical protein
MMTMVYRPRPCAVPRTPGTTARKTIAIVFGKVWTPLQGADRVLSLAHAKTDKQVVSLFFFFLRNKAKCCRLSVLYRCITCCIV